MDGRRLCQIALVLAAIVACGEAFAGHGYYGHRGGYFHARARVGVGVYIGPGFAYGYPYPYAYPAPYYYPDYYPPAVVMSAPSAPQYIEQGADGNPVPVPGDTAPPAQAFWYHCDRPEGYYPYVRACPGGWQQVPAQPPPNY